MNVIFDFDGTIANTMPILIDEYYKWAKPKQPLSPHDIEILRNLSHKEVFEKLKISPWRSPGLLTAGKRRLKKRIIEVETFPGMYDVLHKLKSKHKLFIVSSNSKFNVETFLADQDIAECFDRVYTRVSVARKAAALRKAMRNSRVGAGDCFYVGDEVRDIEAAKKVHMRCIAVTWGYNGERLLSQYQPDYLARQPNDLLVILS